MSPDMVNQGISGLNLCVKGLKDCVENRAALVGLEFSIWHRGGVRAILAIEFATYLKQALCQVLYHPLPCITPLLALYLLSVCIHSSYSHMARSTSGTVSDQRRIPEQTWKLVRKPTTKEMAIAAGRTQLESIVSGLIDASRDLSAGFYNILMLNSDDERKRSASSSVSSATQKEAKKQKHASKRQSTL